MKASRLAVAGSILLAPLVFFHEVCLEGKAYLLRDLFDWFYPWRSFAAESLARGDFPLWNPYSYAGTPFLANMQSGLLYPPNVVFWIFDFPAAMRLFLVIQFALAAWFMFLLLRAHGCRAVSAMTGALGYAYGGWMIVHIEFPNKLAAAAWLPLIVLGLTFWWRGRRLRGSIIGAIATACCVAAGYPQTSFTMLLGAGVLWCAALATAARRRGAGPAAALDTAVSMPAVVALGALLAAAQIVPFLEAMGLSAAVEPHDVLKRGMSPYHFLDLIYPHLFGLPGYSRYWGGSLLQFWLGHFYVGLITLGLAVAGCVARRAGTGGCVALLGLATAFCLGDWTPLAPFCVYFLPGFIHFRWMSTTSILIAFPICWLAAYGLDLILDEMEGARRLPRFLLPGLVALAACAVLAGGMAVVAEGRFDALDRALVSRVALPAQTEFIAGHLDPTRADAIRSGLLAAILTSTWLVCRAARMRRGVVAVLVPLALFVDLKGAAAGINYAGDPALYRETAPNVQRLLSRPDPLFRVYVPDDTLARDLRIYGSEDPLHFRWAADTLLFNLNLPHRIFSASDGDPLWSSRWEGFHRRIEAEGGLDARSRLIALANVAVILKVGTGVNTEVIDVPAYMPRVYLADGARRVRPGDALGAMLESGWHPRHEVLVEDDFSGSLREPSGEPLEEEVGRVEYTNNTVTIEVEASRRCYLVLADANYPGWRAAIDGGAVPIFTANHLFRGIDLPAGRHSVRFEYRPASVRWGVAGSALGLSLLGAGGLWSRRRTRG